jgi:hypothetical protein
MMEYLLHFGIQLELKSLWCLYRNSKTWS